MLSVFFFQAEDGIRDLVRSRGLGDVYKRQAEAAQILQHARQFRAQAHVGVALRPRAVNRNPEHCLLYTSDAADERSSVDLGGRRIIKKKKKAPLHGWSRNAKHTHRPTYT